jgi:hypothetical protein
MNNYDVLVSAGHSPFKAAEIALDAGRGDVWAIRWIETLRQQAERRNGAIRPN